MTKIKHWIFFVLVSVSLGSHAQSDDAATNGTLSDSGVVGFIVKDGFFIAGDLGIFSTFNGYGTVDPNSNVRPKALISMIQPLFGLTVGYDFSRNFGLGLKLASASVSNSALSATDLESPSDFGLFMVDGNVMGAVSLSTRLRLVANAFGGLTVMVPPAVQGGNPYGANAGVSLGLLYDTLLADMVIGFNITGYGFFNFGVPETTSKNFFGASISPVLKYVF